MSVANLWSEERTGSAFPQLVRNGLAGLAGWARVAARSKLAWLLLVVAVAGAVVAVQLSARSERLVAHQPLVFHTVQRSNLEISVIERGNLESQREVEIICEVDTVRRDGVNGTPIVWIVPNGASVREGDLLVELDSAPMQEAVDQQVLDTERARSQHIQAQATLLNQYTQNETRMADAELAVKLAELELEMFKDPENGTHKLEMEDLMRSIEDLNNDILSAQANLELRRNDKLGIESLFKLGYAGKSELDRSRLDFLQAESQYVARMNRLQTQLAALEKKQSYEHQMQMLKLEGALDTAKRNLIQAERDNEARLEQAKAAATAAEESLRKEEERLERYETQLVKCKIYAPQDGMVVYVSRRGSEIREGVAVRQRQAILSLPNLRVMQVQTSVHESVMDQIREGLPATIRVDAFPDRVYEGRVESVAVLPDQGGWLANDTKVYETVVVIDEEVEQLRPGMTAVTEIHIDRLDNVLSVPIQAIVQIGTRNWCYVRVDGRLERRQVQLGRTNDRHVEIREGLNEGEQVVLNPMALATDRDDDRDQQQDQTAPEELEEPAELEAIAGA